MSVKLSFENGNIADLGVDADGVQTILVSTPPTTGVWISDKEIVTDATWDNTTKELSVTKERIVVTVE